MNPQQPRPPQILCVHLRNWPIDRLRRRPCAQVKPLAASRSVPLVIVHPIASRELIVALSDEARALGIRPGMTLAEARALCAAVAHAPHEPRKDARALEALARWMMRFSPVVAIGETQNAERETQNERLAGAGASHASFCVLRSAFCVFLDVTGCGPVFRGMENLVRQVIAALARLRLDARVAVAPTVGAAWALAMAGREDGRIFAAADLPDALRPLPIEALRLNDATVATLRHLGIKTIGQALRLPRRTLPSRFGPLLLQRLDQATGALPEPLVPLAYQAPLEAGIDFDGVVESLETLWEAIRKLIEQVTTELTRRGCGARRVEATFIRPGGMAPVCKSILLSLPSRDQANLFNLLRCAMERVGEGTDKVTRGQGDKAKPLAASRWRVFHRYVPEGFTGLRLRICAYEPLTDEQIYLLEQQSHAGQRELARLVERLRAKLGDEAVMQAELVESYLPEQAYRCVIQARREMQARRHGGTKARRERLGNQEPSVAAPSPSCLRASVPSCLPLNLSVPREIGVMVSPSHDRDGRPVAFNDGGRVYRVAHAIGPHRVAGPWWQGRDKTRDYFDVSEEAGRRFWIFRVNQTGKWYVQGEFG